MDLLKFIQNDFNLESLAPTRKQKQILQYLWDHPGQVCHISLKELSLRAGCTEVTLLRLFQHLGFSGYMDFKKEYKLCYEKAMSQRKAQEPGGFSRSEAQNQQLLAHICQQEAQHIEAYLGLLDLKPIIQAARAIAASEYTILLGRGLSKFMLEFFNYRLGLLGIRTMEINPEETNTLRGRMSVVDSRTAIVAMTFPGYMEELNKITEFAQSQGARVIGITDSAASPIVPNCSPIIYCSFARGTIYNSYLSVLAVINLIAHFIAIERGVGQQKHKEASLEILRLSAEGRSSLRQD